MLCYGLEKFAPIFNGVSSAVVHAPTPATDSNMHADIIRSSCIKETIAHMLMYSGVRVSVSRCDDNVSLFNCFILLFRFVYVSNYAYKFGIFCSLQWR